MISIEDELRTIYENDNIPMSKDIVPKRLKIEFPDLQYSITPDKVSEETLELKESICSDEELTLGGCEASSIKFTVADIDTDINGAIVKLTQTVDGKYEMPLGTYRVDSAKKTDDLRFKEVTAYDLSYAALTKDVADWYNNLSFPLSLKRFRESLFLYLGLTLEEQELINDDIQIDKTIEPSSLTAREVARAIGEITGTFGLMRRTGKFKYVSLSPKGLYPSETLFPSETLYPSEANAYIGAAGYITTKYEDYQVQEIDSLKICMEEGDVGAVVPENSEESSYSNAYIIVGNFLVYGKSHEELTEIANNIFNNIKGITYQPHTTTMIGLPYLEPGDSLVILKNTDAIDSYIFSRTLTGVQALRDEVEAAGSEYRGNEVTPNQEIQILKGKSLVLSKTVDGLSLKITDVERDAAAKIEATATEIRGEVSTLDESLRSTISQTATQIRTEIANEVSGLNSSISQTATNIRTEIADEVKGLNSTIDQTSASINTRITNEVSGLNSTIAQTATQIRTEIADEVKGLNSSISQTASSINTRITNEVSGLSSSISQTESSLTTKIANEVSGLNSTISQTESSLTTKIANEVSGLNSTISQTESNLTSKILSVSGDVSSLSQTVSSLSSKISSVDGRCSSIIQDLETIDFKIEGLEGDYSELKQTVDGFDFTGYVTVTDLSTKGSTCINGSNITTGKLTGVAAEFTEQDGAFWTGGDIWVCDTNGLYCYDGRSVSFRVYADSGVIDHCGEIYPDDSWYKGWGITECLVDLYETVSDKRLKHSVADLKDSDIEFIYSIKPVSFIYNDKREDESTHYGFIAQNVKEEMEKRGVENVICSEITSGRNKGYYGLTYNEFIAPIVGAIQQLNNRLKKLEGL